MQPGLSVPSMKTKSISENDTIVHSGSFFLFTGAALSLSPSLVIKMSYYVVNMAGSGGGAVICVYPVSASCEGK